MKKRWKTRHLGTLHHYRYHAESFVTCVNFANFIFSVAFYCVCGVLENRIVSFFYIKIIVPTLQQKRKKEKVW